MKPIPFFVIEEHNEAFLIWNYAVLNKIISKENNVLLHVDEHSDMNIPRFNKSIHNVQSEMNELTNFTRKELGIASFIIPAIYLGIFSEVYWFKQGQNEKNNEKNSFYVRSYNAQGKKLISGLNKGLKETDDDRKDFKYFKRNIEGVPSTSSEVILDIDLDYFSCAGMFNDFDPIYIEITESEYNSFKYNKYHRLQYAGLGKVDILEREQKYYYVINGYEEIYPCGLKVDEETIKARVDLLISSLQEKKIRPKLITICRSRYSGYTPEDQWEFIESYLMERLKSIYNISQKNIEEIINSSKK